MHGTLQPLLTREVLAAIAGHLMQPPEMANALTGRMPEAPAEAAC